jgi:hypothetical protein
VVQVLLPLLAELLLRDPLGEHLVEAPADVQQPLLEAPSRPTLGGGALVLVLQVVVVMCERLELLAARQPLQVLERVAGRQSADSRAVTSEVTS